jgi:DNA-binding SARP family transcriptional activator
MSLDPLQLLPVLQSLASESEALQSKLSLAQSTLLGACLQGGQLPWLGSALTHLMLPEHRRTLQEAMDWLLPKLLTLTSPELQPLLVRLCRQECPLLTQLLRQQKIEEDGRLFLVEALEGWSSSAHDCLALLTEDPSPRVRERARNLKAGRAEKETRIAVQITTFGGFEMWVAHQKIADSAWRGSRVKHLAAYLAISPRPVHQERLLELFWPDQLERGQRGLSSALSVIRGSCRDFAELQGKSLLVREAECVLIPDDFQRWVDCQEFSRLIRQADQAEDAEARSALLQRAVSLYAGPFLEGCFFDWALQLQGEYETLALQAMLQLSALELEQRRWLSALQTAQRALRIDPLQLQAAGTILKAHIGGGHTEQALQFFQGFQLRYEEELGQSLSFDQALAASSSS